MKRCILLGAAVVFALGMASQASAATIYTQSNILRGPDVGNNCGGANHGKCTIYEVAGSFGTSATQNDNIKISCLLKGAPANATFEVFWTCTTVARGCHSQACGFISLGTFATGATGTGKFTKTIGNNPFPGNYVHLDVLGANQVYASVYAGIPIGTGAVAPQAAGVQAGDPTQ
jgi:hypothetical protein